MMSQPAIVIGVSLLVLLTAIAIGIPIAFSIALAAISYLVFVDGFYNTIGLIGMYSFSTSTNYILVSLPLFIFMAEIVAGSGIAGGMFDFTSKWLSWLPGGLAVAAVWASALFGAVCGSAAATAAVMGRMAIPAMLDHNYSKSLAFGSVTGSAALGQIIPPSIALIIYGALANESVGKLFLAGILPGVMLATVLTVYIVFTASRNRELAPRAQTVSWSERWVSIRGAWPAIVLFIVVLGSIYAGIASITESAAAGAVGALFIAATSGKLKWAVLKESALSTVRLTCFIIALLIGGNLFGHLTSLAGVSGYVGELAKGLHPWALMLVVSLLWLLMGCFLDMATIMVLTIPVLMPAFEAAHWDTVWLGIVVLFNMCVGAITPPVGTHFFVTKGVGDTIADKYGRTSLEFIIQSCVPYIWLTVIAMIIVILFPPLSTWIPAHMMKPVTFK